MFIVEGDVTQYKWFREKKKGNFSSVVQSSRLREIKIKNGKGVTEDFGVSVE